ncbi:MAG: HaeII family restriction endonuclease, partial [Nitrososphaerales archaeon]
MPTPVELSKKTLDILIQKQRVALYKPIQIAEILYHVRTQKELTLENLKRNLESYRNISKKWRDSVTLRLVGHFSTSSQKYQDNLFEANAIPPEVLFTLAEENEKYKGIVERYIYQQFRDRQKRVLSLAKLLDNASAANFKLKSFLNEFVTERGIRRSIDKAYEIIVYALFDTLVKHLKVQVRLSADNSNVQLIQESEEFAKAVLGIDSKTPSLTIDAKLY